MDTVPALFRLSLDRMATECCLLEQAYWHQREYGTEKQANYAKKRWREALDRYNAFLSKLKARYCQEPTQD